MSTVRRAPAVPAFSGFINKQTRSFAWEAA